MHSQARNARFPQFCFGTLAAVLALLTQPVLAQSTVTAGGASVSPRMIAMVEATSPFARSATPPEPATDPGVSSSMATATIALPEAPRSGNFAGGQQPPVAPVAPLYDKEISAGFQAQPINARDKVIIGLRDLYSFGNFGAMFLSAGYEQVDNSQPNYGVDKGAFGERLGAAAIRETAQGLFTDTIFCPLLHQDPRYYVEGPQYNPVHRTLYAVTRALISRTDSGRSTVNGALLLGYAGSAGLALSYYPQSNRNARDFGEAYAGSIGGAALGFFVNEFTDDVLVALHLKKPM